MEKEERKSNKQPSRSRDPSSDRSSPHTLEAAQENGHHDLVAPKGTVISLRHHLSPLLTAVQHCFRSSVY
ncbi:hypothetical protein DFH29DRAFT_858096 [Suillus ampliporus]|nr:hypothetical protein DFH29DRAFT_858096 [Suillus ampliporus]